MLLPLPKTTFINDTSIPILFDGKPSTVILGRSYALKVQGVSTRRVGTGPSLQVRNRKGSAKKADAQGVSQFFLLCKLCERRQ
jgi:hypothetical protein